MKHTPEYHAYHDAKQRCTNPKVWNFKRYGGRGILFRFTSFEQFISEIGPKPSQRHQLDRIKNERHYEPGNVRWATPQQNARNRTFLC